MPQYKNILLVLVQGFGLSSSWQKNVINSAPASGFMQMLQEYEHEILKSPVDELSESPLFDAYSVIGTGEKKISNKLLVDSKLEKNSFHSEELNKCCANSVKHNSCLHLVGSLSKKNSSLEHLIAIINSAKKNNVQRVMVHLLVDGSFSSNEEAENKLKQWEEKIEGSPVADISTICGLDEALNNMDLYIRLLYSGVGQRYLSPLQALAHHNHKRPLSCLQPCAIGNTRRGYISDFDSILFFNHTASELEPLMAMFMSNIPGSGKKPRYLYTTALVSYPTYLEQLKFIFDNSPERTLGQLFAKHELPSLFVVEREMLPVYRYYVGSASCTEYVINPRNDKEYVSQPEIILNTIKELMAKKSHHFSTNIIDLSMLPKICKLGKFDDIAKTIRAIDKFLVELKLFAKKENSLLLISSPFGMVEELSFASQQPIFSKNRLPLLYVAEGMEKTNHETLLSELLKDSSHGLKYLRQSIFKFFNVVDGV